MGKRGASLVCVPSSGNVFADLELPDAIVLDAKLRLAVEINRLIGKQRRTRVGAAERFDVSQPKICALKNYELGALSVECLMSFLLALGRDVEIRITPRQIPRAAGRIAVVRVT